jgi:hypothetical protein
MFIIEDIFSLSTFFSILITILLVILFNFLFQGK